MIKNILKKIRILHNVFIKNNFFFKQNNYSLEDKVLNKIFKNTKKGFYVDVGCNHPTRNNNTFFLYKMGWNGINIDINKFSIDLFNLIRPRDINVRSLILDNNKPVKFYYQKEFSVLNTTNKNIANKHFNAVYKTKIIKPKTLNQVLDKSKYKNKQINFLNIDVEGAELKVLKSINFKVYKPKIICLEILSAHYSKNKFNNLKKNSVYKYLVKKKYKKIWTCKYFRNHIFAR